MAVRVEVRFVFRRPDEAPWVSVVVHDGVELRGVEVYYPHDFGKVDSLMLTLPKRWRKALRAFLSKAYPALARELGWPEAEPRDRPSPVRGA